ncbi:LysR family transcriptional regulator [Rhodoligotrophos defluvii]|uniref:LysR family transcriptional regulator n=1 Tax=Rhodoligotrophos defluvii TaxID=2561934 RepID=UPI0010C99842|nr:LysR substrate-binding domain-containing protein [Rhodoligotrophos defluvii]
MEFRELEAFRATVLHGTVSSAAAYLGISQPTISRLLSDLEHSLGFPLFVRRKGRIVPTEQGMDFYHSLQEVFDALTRLKSRSEAMRKESFRTLTIISMPALSMTVVPQIIDRFLARVPEATVRLMTVDVPTYFRMVREAHVDAGFGNQIGDQPGIEQETLATVDYICALPQGHRLAEREHVTLEEIRKEPLISLSELNENIFRQHDRLLAAGQYTGRTSIQTQNSATAYALVRRGLGIALLEPFSASFWEANGVVTRPFRPRLSYRYSVSINRNTKPNRSLKTLLRIAREVFRPYDRGQAS